MPIKTRKYPDQDSMVEYIKATADDNVRILVYTAIEDFCQLDTDHIAEVPSQSVFAMKEFLEKELKSLDIENSSNGYIIQKLAILGFLDDEYERYDLDRIKEWVIVHDPESGRLHFMEVEIFPEAHDLIGAMRCIGSQKEMDDVAMLLTRMELKQLCHCHLNLDDQYERNVHRILFEERLISVKNLFRDAAATISPVVARLDDLPPAFSPLHVASDVDIDDVMTRDEGPGHDTSGEVIQPDFDLTEEPDE